MGGSILVVEDEAAIRDLLAANLQRAGYRVMTAGDVPQAEALVRESRPDLVLLDWVLPGVPGLTFARRLRGDQRTKDISIVLLSARAEEQDKVTALESGADDYVTKPFSARELLARAPAGRGVGRACVRGRAHGGRPHPAPAPGAHAHGS